MRDKLGRFIKGHKCLCGSEKGWFKKGETPYSKLHPECMRRGENHPMFGKHPSKETRKKIGKASLGRKYSDEVNKKKGSPKERNPNWKGGVYTSEKGYVFLSSPGHPRVNKAGYVKRANLIMEAHIGRYLTPKEIVHHKGKVDDDRIELLELFESHSAHMKAYCALRSSLA